MRRFATPLLSLALLLATAACPDANATPIRLLSVAVSCSDGGACYVKGAFTVPSQADGKGAIDAILTAKKQGTDSIGHTLAATVRRDSFALTPPAVGQTVTGQFCVVAKRRALTSAAACRAFSYTREDSPPAPIILDSVMVGLERIFDEAERFQGLTLLLTHNGASCEYAYCSMPHARTGSYWLYCPSGATTADCRTLLTQPMPGNTIGAYNVELVRHLWLTRDEPVYGDGTLWNRS